MSPRDGDNLASRVLLHKAQRSRWLKRALIAVLAHTGARASTFANSTFVSPADQSSAIQFPADEGRQWTLCAHGIGVICSDDVDLHLIWGRKVYNYAWALYSG